LTDWYAWNDWINHEPVAVEQAAMTEALRAHLAHEKADVRTVQAADRRAAVRLAFPECFVDDRVPPTPRRRMN